MSIRLINTTTLRMKVFVGDRVPKYAILSHTWVEDEEVDFQEMTSIIRDHDHPAARKSGYAKIYTTCEKARRHHIDYAWIDTCCIDKSSSAELSEAINSMFKWYRDAEVCYAFLSDLSTGLVGHENVGAAMGSCRWFKRCWTLQELIAPVDLRFYNGAWAFVGTKTDLTSAICAITGIDKETLNDCSLISEIPVAQRMSWASEREATRSEDIAYCLLGIFDVNMPLLYGEGQKAFIRLQEQIIGRSNDLSIFWNFTTGEASPEELTEFIMSEESTRAVKAENAAVHDPGHHLRLSQVAGSKFLSRLSFRDLFASSPRAFSSVGTIIPPAQSKGRAKFTGRVAITNSGIRFEDVSFDFVRTMGKERRYFYALHLHHCCRPANVAHKLSVRPCYIILEKIGPASFVRCEVTWHDYQIFVKRLYGLPNRSSEREYAYVVTKVPRLIQEQLRESRAWAIRIETQTALTRTTISVLEPAPWQVWNGVQQEFLTFQASFLGHVLLHIREARESSVLEYECYLECELERWGAPGSELGIKLLDPKEFSQHRTQNLRDRERDLLRGRTSHGWPARDSLILNGAQIKAKAKRSKDDDDTIFRIRVELKRDERSKALQ